MKTPAHSNTAGKSVRATFSARVMVASVALFSFLFMAGCQQVESAYQKTSQEADTLKNQVIDTKNKVEEKVTQAQQAADAIKKLAE